MLGPNCITPIPEPEEMSSKMLVGASLEKVQEPADGNLHFNKDTAGGLHTGVSNSRSPLTLLIYW
jgi:hypothetical protein